MPLVPSKDTYWKHITDLYADDLVAALVGVTVWCPARMLIRGDKVLTPQGWAQVNYAPTVEQARLKWY